MVANEDPWAAPGYEPMTVSIKPSAEYDSALLVFKGTPARIAKDLVEFFELPAEDVEGMSPWHVFQEAEARARYEANPTSKQGYGKAGGFKNKPAAKTEDVRPGGAAKQADEPTHEQAVETVKEGLGAETVVEDKPATDGHPHADILEAIEAATSKRDLAKLTQNAEWKPFILRGDTQDPDVAAAFKAKGATF